MLAGQLTKLVQGFVLFGQLRKDSEQALQFSIRLFAHEQRVFDDGVDVLLIQKRLDPNIPSTSCR